MENSKTMHLRLSDSLNTDLKEYAEVHGTSKSKITRELIEDKIYRDDNILPNSDELPLDSPFYLTDFLKVILRISMGIRMDRAYQYHVAYYISIMERDFEKLDSEMKKILIPFLKDLDRLRNDIEEKPDARHYYMFEIDMFSLRVYLNQNVLLY